MDFSVIVSVRNEAATIDRCLSALLEQDFAGDYEVIVVDGMSSDGTRDELARYGELGRILVLDNEKLNAAAGRNLGIAHAQSEYVAFVDGDAVPDNDWLRQIAAAFEGHSEAAGVGGPDLLPEDSQRWSRIFAAVMTSPVARGGRLNPSTQHSLSDQGRYVGHIPTCNLCLKKSVVESIGMFDESFVKGQDLELNYRIVEAGHKLLYSPRITVRHYRKESLGGFVRQIYKWAKAKIAIVKKHGLRGLASHVYLWPLYMMVLGILTIVGFYLVGALWLVGPLLLAGAAAYGLIILIEAIRLSRRFAIKGLLISALFLLPLVHLIYAGGVLAAAFRRQIW